MCQYDTYNTIGVIGVDGYEHGWSRMVTDGHEHSIRTQ